MEANTIIQLVSIFVVIVVSTVELHLVEDSGQAVYLWGRILNTLGFVWLFFSRAQKERVWYGIAWTGLFYFYCYLGEWYRPLYIMALLQVQILHALYFRHTRYSFPITHVLGTGIFTFILTTAWEKNIVRLSHSSVQDQLTIALCSLIASFLVYLAIERARIRSENVTKRLALIGSYATSLIHDLKNLSAAPLLYSEYLVSNKNASPHDSQTAEIAELLNSDLKKIQFLVRELYNTTRISTVLEEKVSLRDVVRITEQVLGPRLEGIKLEVVGESQVETDPRILQVILLNLFYNSIAGLKRRAIADKRIIVRIGPSKLEVASNSVGDSISSDSQSSSGVAGLESGGMGLVLMEELAGKTNIRFQQITEGDCWVTTLSFG